MHAHGCWCIKITAAHAQLLAVYLSIIPMPQPFLSLFSPLDVIATGGHAFVLLCSSFVIFISFHEAIFRRLTFAFYCLSRAEGAELLHYYFSLLRS